MRKVFTRVWTTDFKHSWASCTEEATESQIEYTRQQIIEFLKGQTGCFMQIDNVGDNVFIPREVVGYVELVFVEQTNE